MAADYSRLVRRAILPALKGNGPLLDLIPAASMFPSTVPATRAFPFIRYGVTIPTPFRATGLDSTAMNVRIDAFTKAVTVNGALTETAEDRSYRIADAIAQALDLVTLTLENGLKARIVWTGSLCTMDGDEADAWHATVNVRVEVSG